MRSFKTFFFLIVIFSSTFQNFSDAAHRKRFQHAVVVGTVFCETCFQQDFSKNSRFISGASVAVDCEDADTKQRFHEEARTNKHGEFRVHLPFTVAKHAKKLKGCSVKLVRSSEPHCSVAATAASSLLHLKSRKEGIHYFSAGFFTFKPLKQPNLCNQKPSISNSQEFKSQKTFLAFPTPTTPLNQNFLPPLPTLPTLPTFPQLPTLPTLPTLPQLPTLPTLPQLPTLPALPTLPGLPNTPEKTLPLSNQKLESPINQNSNNPETFFFPPNPLQPPSFLPPNPLQPPSLFPPNPFQPPSLFPPNPFQPPPSLIPNPLQPPPSVFPPNPFHPPSPPAFGLPPLPGLTPSPPPPAPVFPGFPPFPFQPIPGVPPVFSSTQKTSP